MLLGEQENRLRHCVCYAGKASTDCARFGGKPRLDGFATLQLRRYVFTHIFIQLARVAKRAKRHAHVCTTALTLDVSWWQETRL